MMIAHNTLFELDVYLYITIECIRVCCDALLCFTF